MHTVFTYCVVRISNTFSNKVPFVLTDAANDFDEHTHTHTHTYSVLTAIFPGEPGLAGCPLNSPSPFIRGLRILLGQT